eukprot:445848-Pleurochrysis_carterae.AAC.1
MLSALPPGPSAPVAPPAPASRRPLTAACPPAARATVARPSHIATAPPRPCVAQSPGLLAGHHR